LVIAAYEGRLKTVELLLAHGANVDAAARGGFTPLIMAAQKGHTAVVVALLGAGADIDAKGDQGFTALLSLLRRARPPWSLLCLLPMRMRRPRRTMEERPSLRLLRTRSRERRLSLWLLRTATLPSSVRYWLLARLSGESVDEDDVSQEAQRAYVVAQRSLRRDGAQRSKARFVAEYEEGMRAARKVLLPR
jgi:hypothetical protein